MDCGIPDVKPARDPGNQELAWQALAGPMVDKPTLTLTRAR